jgi:hypothetical protein
VIATAAQSPTHSVALFRHVSESWDIGVAMRRRRRWIGNIMAGVILVLAGVSGGIIRSLAPGRSSSLVVNPP